jgi:hypothetical protein
MAEPADNERDNMFHKSALYQEFLAERAEILRHKWIESEKAGHDIGFEKALLDWIVKHRAGWRTLRQQKPLSGESNAAHKSLQVA